MAKKLPNQNLSKNCKILKKSSFLQNLMHKNKYKIYKNLTFIIIFIHS